ncbi:unnamed protein product [Amoebophrya sp. A120]|nr:unnamed protein product [Amoebophrya sp. A120]|eukprot:GSA120T00006620001.1
MQGAQGLYNFGDIYNPQRSGSGTTTGPRPNPLPKTLDPSDWECPNEKCKNINFKKRETCNRCGLKKPVDAQPDPRVARHIAAQEAALASTTRWQCPHCGTQNMPGRVRCETCNAPRITQDRMKSKLEHQGRGGGYMDRQQDVDRRDYNSDEESVDDFGRKKKKKGAAARVGPAPFRGKKKHGGGATDQGTVPGTVPGSKSLENIQTSTRDHDAMSRERSPRRGT